MEWLQDSWWLLPVFALVCIIFAVGLYFAVKSTAAHNKTVKAYMAEIEELTRLKDKYKDITADDLVAAPDEEVLAGVNAVYQSVLSKAETDTEALEAFDKFSDAQKNLYTLQIFLEDGGATEFFSKNADMLVFRLIPALDMIGMSGFGEKLADIVKMHDKDDETVSYEKSKIVKIDEYVEEHDILTEIKLKASKYIKDNFDSVKI